jgi:hypothetical protein
MALDLRFWVQNTLEKRSVKMCGTPEDQSLNGSHPLDVGETTTVDLPRRVCDSGFR